MNVVNKFVHSYLIKYECLQDSTSLPPMELSSTAVSLVLSSLHVLGYVCLDWSFGLLYSDLKVLLWFTNCCRFCPDIRPRHQCGGGISGHPHQMEESSATVPSHVYGLSYYQTL